MIDKLIRILNYIISFLDKFEKDDEKIIHSFGLNGISLETDTGFKPANFIHLTKPFQTYHIDLQDNYHLDCADNHIVFDENMNEVFAKNISIGTQLVTDDGLKEVTNISIDNLKQCMCDVSIGDENHRYYTNGILSHNTTMSAIFLLWYVIFNVDKNALVVANKRKTAVEILDKIKKIYLELPYYLKPGIYKWNESEIVFDNGCRIMAEATTINSGISFTFHVVLWDEAAHVAPNIKEKFYNNLFPTITAGKSRFMITSTQNGFDLFCRLYKAAEQHLNEYAAFKTDWDEVPEWNPDKRCWEKRDEAWHQLQVANYGSEEAFNAQFGTNFDINANTLIDPKFLRKKQHEAEEFEYRDLLGVSGSEFYKWKPGFDPMEDLKKSFITVTIDIAEGIGKDFTTFIFNKMTPTGDECVGMFHCNTMNIDKATVSLMEICIKYLNPNQHCISLEWNTYGELFLKIMMNNRDKYPSCSNFDESNIIKYYNDTMTKVTMGIKLTSASKAIGCKLFKDQFEHDHIVNKCTDFLMEVENFSDSKDNGTYQASFGHDDIIMAQIQLVHAKQSNAYKYLRSEYESSLTNDYQESINKDNDSNIAPGYSYAQVDMSQYKDGQFFDPTKVFRSMDDIYNSIDQRAQNSARQGIPSMWN